MLIRRKLTDLERAALQRALSTIDKPAWRDALLKQLDGIVVSRRTPKTTGYYVDFNVASALRIPDLPNDFNKTPPEAAATHPDGANALFFIVYVKDGALSFMEVASTADWPEREDLIVFREAERKAAPDPES